MYCWQAAYSKFDVVKIAACFLNFLLLCFMFRYFDEALFKNYHGTSVSYMPMYSHKSSSHLPDLACEQSEAVENN